MRLVVLCENSVISPGPLLAEHGFACLVEAHGRRVLFDTGQGRTLLHNADVLGVQLSELDAVILSHGHYDHAGGLPGLLQRHAGLRVVYHPDAFLPRLAMGPKGSRDIGIPFAESELSSWSARPDPCTDAVELFPGLWLSGEVPRVNEYEAGDEQLRLGAVNDFPGGVDPVKDDLSLAIQTERGLVVLVGCAHAGPINILRHFQQITGEYRIQALIGGTHLGPVSDRQYECTLAALEELGVEQLGLSHCTGLLRSADLLRRWPQKAFFAGVGCTVNG